MAQESAWDVVPVFFGTDREEKPDPKRLAYSAERGHPRLRMRHFPFPVGPRQRDRWLVHMTNAVEANTEEGEIRDSLLRYFNMAAEQMVNRPGD